MSQQRPLALRNYPTRSIPVTIPQECRNDVRVRTVCNRTGRCKISTYNDQRGVCNLVSNHLSSFYERCVRCGSARPPRNQNCVTAVLNAVSQSEVLRSWLRLNFGRRSCVPSVGPYRRMYLPRRRRKDGARRDGARRECPISASIKARAASPKVGERSGRHFVVRPGPCHRRASSLSSTSVARAKVKRPSTNRRSISGSSP